ncbi:hypothetical protein GCM10009108_22080 [Castellaniella ginsengisoli]|uniref:Uncharacterized protein n=1 Tax=Castellaniella ginsengisoli TaxID=546114 RepID=A0ABN1L0N4_9BURK
MSEPAQTGFYSVRIAQDDELAAMATGGCELAKNEMLARLPDRLSALLDLYLVAYGQDREQAIKALGADVGRLSAAS